MYTIQVRPGLKFSDKSLENLITLASLLRTPGWSIWRGSQKLATG